MTWTVQPRSPGVKAGVGGMDEDELASQVKPGTRRPQRVRRPTMVDVAREAGVALRTVSRVANGDPTVGEPLAERVRQAIADLNFQPDERARQLRSGVSATVGAAVRNIFDAHPVLRTIEEAARELGLTVIAMSTEEDEVLERDAIMSMCRRRMDGIIVEPTAESHDYLQPEIDAGLAVVAFDRPAVGVAVDTVLSHNRGGIEAAYEHLVRHGHKRIAYIGDDERIYTGREHALPRSETAPVPMATRSRAWCTRARSSRNGSPKRWQRCAVAGGQRRRSSRATSPRP